MKVVRVQDWVHARWKLMHPRSVYFRFEDDPLSVTDIHDSANHLSVSLVSDTRACNIYVSMLNIITGVSCCWLVYPHHHWHAPNSDRICLAAAIVLDSCHDKNSCRGNSSRAKTIRIQRSQASVRFRRVLFVRKCPVVALQVFDRRHPIDSLERTVK